MLHKPVAYYCQKCLAANALGQEFCGRCGTRLMLVVEPPAARFEVGDANLSYEEHLLERVSALENRMVQLAEKLERGMDLLLKQARNSYFDHVLIETLIAFLHAEGVIDAAQLDRLWQERRQHEADEQLERERLEALQSEIMAADGGRDPRAFERMVGEGIGLIRAGELARGVRSLERASAAATRNAPLVSFLGSHFFAEGKMRLARDYLERAFLLSQHDGRLRVLLGIACGDEGEVERAKELLGGAPPRYRASFAVHYGMGRLLVAEKRWTEALAEFKSALAARPSPEAHYVLGNLYYQLERDRMAKRHLRRAVEMDGTYREAFYLLGLVLLRSGEHDRAAEAFDAAGESEGGQKVRTRKTGRRPRVGRVPRSSPLFASVQQAKTRLMTCGDARLDKILREDALEAGRREAATAGSGVRVVR